MRRLYAIVAGLFYLCAPTSAHADSRRIERFLLVIAANAGDEGEQHLRWADADARAFGALMRDVGGIEPGHHALVTGADADMARGAFRWISEQMHERVRQGIPVELITYIASHADPVSLHLSGTRLPVDELRNWFEGTPARTRVMLLDICYGAGIWDRSGADGVRSVVRKPGAEGTVYISASSANEVAQESEALGGGFFTSHLMSGLRGAADRNGDGEVTVSESFSHAYARTVQDSFAHAPTTQHPRYSQDVTGEGDMVLSFLERAEARLMVAGDFSGHLLVVEDRTERVVIDAYHLAAGQPTAYALPVGTYRVLARRNGRVFAGMLVLEAKASAGMPGLREIEVDQLAALPRGRRYDPRPIDLFVQFESFWRWDERSQSRQGLLGVATGLQLDTGRGIFASGNLAYARTLGGNGSWLRSLDVLMAEIEAGYSRRSVTDKWQLGVLAGAGWVQQLARQADGEAVVKTGTAIFSAGGALRYSLPVAPRWDLGLSAKLGVLVLRVNSETVARPMVQVGLTGAFQVY